MYVIFFKQKTAYGMRISDWSSDVCSSDLEDAVHGLEEADRGGLLHDDGGVARPERGHQEVGLRLLDGGDVRGEVSHPELGEQLQDELHIRHVARSAERRVGTECVSTRSSRWSPYH